MTARPSPLPSPAAADGEAGSILAETLIAAAILAMILTAAFEVSASSAARRRKLEARRDALAVARSTLAAVGAQIPLSAGRTQGAEGELVWEVESQPCGSAGAALAGPLYCVSVSVRRGEDPAPLVTLASRRLGQGG